MKAGELLKSKGWIAHPRDGQHPLWSKDGCEPVELSKALELAHAETARSLDMEDK